MMNLVDFSRRISDKLAIKEPFVTAVLALLDEGATIPFIARYRKDRTGALDEVQIHKIAEEAACQKEFDERKAFIVKAISAQGALSPQLREKLDAAGSLAQLEDIYLPYKPKRKTKADAAREKGLAPLATRILDQGGGDPEQYAAGFLNENVADASEALRGARDIIAQLIAEDPVLRSALRQLFEREACVLSRVVPDKEAEAKKYQDYFTFSEPVSKIPSHRILAVLRGFMEGVLRFSVAVDEDQAVGVIEAAYLRSDNLCGQQVKAAVRDAYRRLLQPALENEFRLALKKRADEEAIDVFAGNLRQLLLAAPLGSQVVMAIDPGYRTGCKVVILDEAADLVEATVIFPHDSSARKVQAAETVRSLVATHGVASVAIGDGTAGRETEMFIKELDLGLPVFLVNEDGASIYSASAIAREEFPDQDITVRGAVSIGRRLIDPLAELVKIEPKSIGVGQYQHDVNQPRLKERLDQTVVSCVNAVGVNVNTAGKHLLQYVSGIGSTLAANIVAHRQANGLFTSRRDLLRVDRLGAKAFEQCAGFLRIPSGEHPLDASGVHPEAYPVVAKMAADLGVGTDRLPGNKVLIDQLKPEAYISEEYGQHTIHDIIQELKKPGRDPRPSIQEFEFAAIYAIEDVKEGMIVNGVVTNLTRFGAFVDIGVKQDGLIHISEVAAKFVSDPAEVLQLNQKVKVKVLAVDVDRKRISLSIKQALPPSEKKSARNQSKRSPKRQEGGSRTGRRPENDAATFSDALASLKSKFR